jgi:hypothetical protein
MAVAILHLIQSTLQEEFSNNDFLEYDTDDGHMSMDIFPTIGNILMIEAAFQTAYQLSQIYAGDTGSTEEKFQHEQSSTLTTGKANMNSALSTA